MTTIDALLLEAGITPRPAPPAPPVFRVVATEYAVRAFRGDKLVGSAVIGGFGQWHIPLPPGGVGPRWKSVHSRDEAVAWLQRLDRGRA